MNTKIIISTALILLITIGWIRQSDPLPTVPKMDHTEKIVKGILYNGEVIPMVELPAVEITGDLDRLTFVPLVEHEGVLIPALTLPEVIIQAQAS